VLLPRPTIRNRIEGIALFRFGAPDDSEPNRGCIAAFRGLADDSEPNRGRIAAFRGLAHDSEPNRDPAGE